MNGAGNLSRWLAILFAIVCCALLITLGVSATSTALLRTRLGQAQDELTRLRAAQPKPDHARVAQLEKVVADQAAAYEKLRAQLAAPTERAAPAVGAGATGSGTATNADRGAWLDRLRQDDPERYKQIQDAREQRRQAVEALFQRQFARLDERLQTAQTKDEANLINNLADTLTHMDELQQQWQQVRDLPEDERRAKSQELGADSAQTFQKFSQLRTQDRQLQLQQLAGQLGYQNTTEAKQFVETVGRIIEETDTNPGQFMGGGGFGRRGGGPAGP